MLERVIIVPTRDNDHKPLDYQIGHIRQELLKIAGGYTQDNVTGAWLDGDTTYYDKSQRYTLAVTPEQDSQIVARLPEWCKRLRQDCLYTSVRPVDVTFVTPITETAVA